MKKAINGRLSVQLGGRRRAGQTCPNVSPARPSNKSFFQFFFFACKKENLQFPVNKQVSFPFYYNKWQRRHKRFSSVPCRRFEFHTASGVCFGWVIPTCAISCKGTSLLKSPQSSYCCSKSSIGQNTWPVYLELAAALIFLFHFRASVTTS